MQNGQLWMDYYDLGLERCAFTSKIRCNNPHVRAITGCRDIQKIAETPDIVELHVGGTQPWQRNTAVSRPESP